MKTSYEQEIDRLEGMLHHLRVEFERFFNGALAIPPEELRNEVQTHLRRLRNVSLRNVVDQFRLTGLEARFNSLNELSNRRLRDYEEGRGPAGSAPASRHDVRRGVVLADGADTAAVEALYEGLQRTPGDGPRFDLESFRAYLDRQLTTIRSKTGCREVQFRLAEEGGKIKLKAKPLPAHGPDS